MINTRRNGHACFEYIIQKWSCVHARWNFPYHYQHSVGKLHRTLCYSRWIVCESLWITRDTIISSEWTLHARRRGSRITCMQLTVDLALDSSTSGMYRLGSIIAITYVERRLTTLPLNGSCGCLLHTSVVESGGTWATCLERRYHWMIKWTSNRHLVWHLAWSWKKSEELIVSQQMIKAWSKIQCARVGWSHRRYRRWWHDDTKSSLWNHMWLNGLKKARGMTPEILMEKLLEKMMMADDGYTCCVDDVRVHTCSNNWWWCAVALLDIETIG